MGATQTFEDKQKKRRNHLNSDFCSLEFCHENQRKTIDKTSETIVTRNCKQRQEDSAALTGSTAHNYSCPSTFY
jgi:hypothetical protein